MPESSEFSRYLSDHTNAIFKFAYENIDPIVDVIVKSIDDGKTLYAFGNGGSAAEASHFVAELMGSFEDRLRRPYRAVCLNTDMSVITALANDFDYSHVFTRQVVALVQPGDIVIGFSTSGNSPSIVKAIQTANSLGATTIGFTGAGTHNELRKIAKFSVVAPSERTCIIQEVHQVAIHYIAQEIEKSRK